MKNSQKLFIDEENFVNNISPTWNPGEVVLPERWKHVPPNLTAWFFCLHILWVENMHFFCKPFNKSIGLKAKGQTFPHRMWSSSPHFHLGMFSFEMPSTFQMWHPTFQHPHLSSTFWSTKIPQNMLNFQILFETSIVFWNTSRLPPLLLRTHHPFLFSLGLLLPFLSEKTKGFNCTSASCKPCAGAGRNCSCCFCRCRADDSKEGSKSWRSIGRVARWRPAKIKAHTWTAGGWGPETGGLDERKNTFERVNMLLNWE